jgi:glycosyltransferase involved in cell wall biosynthesis
MSKKLTIIMPAYNAGKTIERVFTRIPTAVYPHDLHCIVVNDGSTDDTSEALARLQRRFGNLVVLDHGVNRGFRL